MAQQPDELAVLREAILQLAEAHTRLVEAVTQDLARLERNMASINAAVDGLYALVGGVRPGGTSSIVLATEMEQLHITRLLRIPVGTDRFR